MKNKISLDNIELHNKHLISRWDYNYFEDKKIKIVDGRFICSNIFSVYIYSTSKEKSDIKQLAQKTTIKISELINDTKIYILNEQQKLERFTTEMISYPFRMPEPILMDIDIEKISPSAMALIKLFIIIDKYILMAHRAKRDGDISLNQHKTFINHAIKQLNVLLNEIREVCIEFHRERKERA
ncbi:hypothetical protein E4T25_08910 [Photobacterium damselae subsp. piscicida]|uniref:hypothetical protein n=1 Tax=Photobacterium damselae TaxID=38293 RepID=UPI0010767FC7|nr:hypothetical protein [Photobacterium damselae]TFZ60112.1 hypothetical protein E4T25_08910 [Photobacterium damselae subsp. piscicida]